VKLAFLVDSPSRRAHANVVARLALGLAEIDKIETTIVSYSADPRPSWLPASVRVHRLGADGVTRSVPSLVRYLRAQQPDVLITRQVHANFAGLAAAQIARVPRGWNGKLVLVQDQFVELCHGVNWRDNKWLAKIAYRFADGLIAPSPTVLADTARFCGLKLSSVGLVPNPIPKFDGVLTAPPHPWLRDGEPPVFVTVSNLLPLKRVDLVIDAFADLRQHYDARLIVVGEGPERSNAAGQIRRLGISASADAVGWVEDPLQFAARACALVHASDEDGFAQVLTEAMSVGCPVITTDSLGGGPRYVTDNGKYGILVPRGDRQKLTEAIASMLQPDVRKHFAELGRKRSEEMSPAASAAALIGFLSANLGIAF
jgi:glycosyltransferase involved in cell wall biosynthesis